MIVPKRKKTVQRIKVSVFSINGAKPTEHPHEKYIQSLFHSYKFI